MFKKKKKIAVLIPFYKFMEAKAVQSLIAMMADIHNAGDTYVPVVCHSIWVERARAALINQTLEQVPDADYVLCIDTDHVYSAKALYALIDRMEKDSLQMLSAAYTARSMPGTYAHVANSEDGKTAKKMKVDGRGGVIDCYAVGFGFVVFRPPMLKDLWHKHGPHLFTGWVDKQGLYQTGDDVKFCELARKEGYRICFDADVKVGHISQVVL